VVEGALDQLIGALFKNAPTVILSGVQAMVFLLL
jgi:hypothetical protein